MLKGIGNLQVFNTEGKWFDFKTTLGDIRLKLRLLKPAEQYSVSIIKLAKDGELLDPKKLHDKTRTLLKMGVVDWEILQEDGIELEFKKELFDDPMFFTYFNDLKLTEPLVRKNADGDEIKIDGLSPVVNALIHNADLFIKEGDTSFL